LDFAYGFGSAEAAAASSAKSSCQLARIPNSNAECGHEKNIQMPRTRRQIAA